MINEKYETTFNNFFSLLTACAPPRPAGEMPLNPGIQDQPVEQNKVISVEKRNAKTSTVSSFEIRGSMAAKIKAKDGQLQ